MSKAVASAATILAIAGGVAAFTQYRAAESARAEAAELAAKFAEQVDRVTAMGAETEKTVSLLKEDIERLRRERDQALEKGRQLAMAGGTGGATGAGANTKQADLRAIMQGFASRLDDPETRKAMRQGQERMVAGVYASLFKKLGLTEDESKLVAELLAERNFAAMDKGRKALAAGDDAAMTSVRQDISATKAEYDAKLKAVLGEEKMAELGSFEQTVGDQRALDFFERNFRGKNVPLEAPQKTALTEIMRQERLKTPSDEIPDLGGGPGVSVLMSEPELKAREQQEQAYQERVVARASEAGLSPDQVTVLQDSFKQRAEWRSFGTRMGRAFIRPQ